jgi:crotonobetaine/carnitine-CoA ligase
VIIREELDAAEERGDRPFLYFEDRSLTSAEYVRLCRASGGAWAEAGVKQGDFGAVLLPNSPEFLATFHGLVSTGGIMVPLNTRYVPDEAHYVLEHSGAKVLLTDRALYEQTIEPIRDRLPRLERVLFIDGGGGDDDFSAMLAADLPAPRPHIADEDVAVVLYTSGTTGRPKGSLTPQAHFPINGRALNRCIDLGADDVHMTVLPLFHQNAEVTTTGALIAGCRLVIAPRFSRRGFWDAVERHGVTHAGYLGSIIPLLDKLEDPREHESTLRVMWGAGLSSEAQQRLELRWGVVFIEQFGMTETGLDVCNPIHGVRKPGSCGLPVEGKNVKISDENDEEVPPGTPGQILVKVMPAVTRGYLNDPEASAQALRGGWMHTGDMAKRDEDGYFYFLDRYKDIIRRSGENMSSAEIEGVVRAHPSILDAAVVPAPDEIRGEEVKAIVVLREGFDEQSFSPEDLREWCSERLAPYKVPRYVEYRDDLQRTSTGKVQKQAMRREHGRFPYYDAAEGSWVRRGVEVG